MTEGKTNRTAGSPAHSLSDPIIIDRKRRVTIADTIRSQERSEDRPRRPETGVFLVGCIVGGSVPSWRRRSHPDNQG